MQLRFLRYASLMLPPQITDHVHAGNQTVEAVAVGHDRDVPGVEDQATSSCNAGLWRKSSGVSSS